MKKIFSALVSLLLVCSFTACSASTEVGNKDTETTTADNISTTIAEETVETSATESAEVSVTEESFSENENTTEKKETTEKTENKTSTTKKKTTSTTVTTKKPVNTTKKPVTTTKKAVTTTKKAVTTTKKPQTTAAPSKKLPSYTPETEIVYLFNKINDYRVQNGLCKLAMDSTLCKIAYLRAIEQRTLKGHTRPDNTDYYTILDEYDYNYYGCGENIAFYRNVSADEIFEKWKNSSAHNQNMTEKRWTKSGMAMCKNSDGTYTIVHLFAC